ncbi:phosphotransferase family protein [Nocardioides aurantiacus]|uniref:Aminoglycoside phosphotransferase (APT) family kinase protein n=1 Tax=Nocardioides aurantiacus TaxID=86796 RepID=A0A3N2CVB1_9ACTN|nr:aminoglycoside phosphotransferase family protein [Nocardioides aurantiacus]ROR91406.1 aminoglycoside phosphotransferase (APT) family kinase protein [Nocardioides aurantiacus]
MAYDEGPGFATSLQPLPGGASGETFLAGAGGDHTVLRLYAARSAARGPLAPEVDAAVLDLVRGVLPVPRVLEVRRGDPGADLPGLLVTSHLPGERLSEVLPELDGAGLHQVGEQLGVLAGRLGLAVQPRAGRFTDRRLVAEEPLPSLDRLLDAAAPALPDGLAAALGPVVDDAEDLLAGEARRVLVHGDLNPPNVLVERSTLEVTGLVDWEFAHAGGPWEDLGNLLRHAGDPVLREAVLAAYASIVPGVPEDVEARAEAADLAALIDLAGRADGTGPCLRATALLARAAGWTLGPGGA